jgi:cell wall-associated NlpC family hydrolase
MSTISPVAGAAGGTGGSSGLRTIAVATVAAVLGLLMLIFMMVMQSAPSTTTASGLNTSAVPTAYIQWVLKAGSICAAITPAIIAAQDQAESNWNPKAVSGAGAEGIAQFLPSSFPQWGRNDDGTGNVSPWNPRDEIVAQGRYDCSLASFAQNLINSGGASGTVTDLALAAYNAGPGGVEQAHGIPAAAASYVREIDSLATSKYAAVTTGTSQSGLTAVAAAESALGTPYQYGGSCSNPHGADPSGWCDCSSLVQMAWRAAGVSIPRTTYQQWRVGTPVKSVSQLVPGDLVFIPGTDATAAGPGHVGMYVGNGMLINAPETGEVVRYESVSSWQSQIVAMRHIG